MNGWIDYFRNFKTCLVLAEESRVETKVCVGMDKSGVFWLFGHKLPDFYLKSLAISEF